jgi:hypothetical protein
VANISYRGQPGSGINGLEGGSLSYAMNSRTSAVSRCRGHLLLAFAALVLLSNSAAANPYDKCMLDHAATIKDGSSDGIDAIAEACIKSTEGPLDADEGAKVRITYLYGEMVRGQGELGLILQVYNGSAFDISSISISLTDKRTQTKQEIRRELWYTYYRGSGFISSYGPRYKNRFIISLSNGEYMFPIGVHDVPQADFFKRYDVQVVSALGVRH